jgi:hypothetical protein
MSRSSGPGPSIPLRRPVSPGRPGLVQGKYPLPGRTGSLRSWDEGSLRVPRITRPVLGATDRTRHPDGRRHGRLHGPGVVRRHVSNAALQLPWPAVRQDRVRPRIRPVDRRASWTNLHHAGRCARVPHGSGRPHDHHGGASGRADRPTGDSGPSRLCARRGYRADLVGRAVFGSRR